MNRYLAAKSLNHMDELAWHTTYQGKPIKCIWRKERHGMCFIAISLHVPEFGPAVENQVLIVLDYFNE
jgi:hypothetical protein